MASYPQIFPHHRRTPELQDGTIEWGRRKSKMWLELIDKYWIGEKPYLCGELISIADYFGSSIVTLGEIIRCDFAAYPNVERWLNTVKQIPSWTRTNKAFYELVDSMRQIPFNPL